MKSVSIGLCGFEITEIIDSYDIGRLVLKNDYV